MQQFYWMDARTQIMQKGIRDRQKGIGKKHICKTLGRIPFHGTKKKPVFFFASASGLAVAATCRT
jgi:hypothetical protein